MQYIVADVVCSVQCAVWKQAYGLVVYIYGTALWFLHNQQSVFAYLFMCVCAIVAWLTWGGRRFSPLCRQPNSAVARTTNKQSAYRKVPPQPAQMWRGSATLENTYMHLSQANAKTFIQWINKNLGAAMISLILNSQQMIHLRQPPTFCLLLLFDPPILPLLIVVHFFLFILFVYQYGTKKKCSNNFLLFLALN